MIYLYEVQPQAKLICCGIRQKADCPWSNIDVRLFWSAGNFHFLNH
jgi:hypothetical protein